MSLEDLKREALKLSFDEREELVHSLYKSLDEEEEDPDIERAIMDEVKRRYEAIQDGRSKLIPMEEVFAELLVEHD